MCVAQDVRMQHSPYRGKTKKKKDVSGLPLSSCTHTVCDPSPNTHPSGCATGMGESDGV